MVKEKARTKLRGLIGRLGAAEIHEKSLAACELLCGTAEFKRSTVVMMYLALAKEVDTSPAIFKAFQQDKTVVVPSVIWKERRLIPLTISGLDCAMQHDRHGVRYPMQGELMPISEIDLIVVPGMGFDEQGNRIGRGGGFYDRFLAGAGFKGIICGLAFEEQVIEKVPVLDHDIRLDMLVTDGGVRRFRRRADAAARQKTQGATDGQAKL